MPGKNPQQPTQDGKRSGGSAQQQKDLSELLGEVMLNQPEVVRKSLEQTFTSNTTLNTMPLSSKLMRSIRSQEPKSIANTLLNTGSKNIDTNVQLPPPKLIMDVNTLARVKSLRPDLDYKNSEFIFQFKQETNAYVKMILEAFDITPDHPLVCPLPVPLCDLSATDLNEKLTTFFQQTVQAKNLAHLGYQHCNTFVNGLTKYIMSLKKPKMNSFQLNQFETQREVFIEYGKAEQIFSKELRYQRLTQTYVPPSPGAPKPVAMTTEESLNRTCTRLYNDYKRNMCKQRQLQQQKQEEELLGCTFQPSLPSSKLFQFPGEDENGARVSDYGVEEYLKKHRTELKNHDEIKVIGFLNQIIDEAHHFDINLTDEYLDGVRQDLESTKSQRLREQIVQHAVDTLAMKYQEIEQIKYMKKLQTGEIQQLKVNFKPNETVFSIPSDIKDKQYEDRMSRKQKMDKQDEQYRMQQLKESEEKIRRANVRAQIFKECKSRGGNMKLSVNEINRRFGKEGVELVLGQSEEVIREQQREAPRKYEDAPRQVLYSSYK